jgi:putative ABC transport system permease protein
MRIIVKFILKNIYEKKFRTILILVSIMLSSALFFASNALQDTMVKMFSDRMKQYYGDTDIVIHSNEKSPSSFLSMSGLEGFRDRLDFSMGLIQGSAVYKPSRSKTVNFQLLAVKPDELQKVNPLSIYSSSGLDAFEGNRIILSKNTADKYGLKDGGTIDLYIRGMPVKFVISALAYPTGLFIDESQSVYAVLPLDTLASMYDARGRVNLICIKVREPAEKQAMMKELSAAYKRYTVSEPFSEEELKQQLSSMTTPFMLMSVIVMLMSIFIIYTSFKVVTMERLPVIGTFRSIGATRKTTDAVLLLESTIYGIIGGALGCVLGLGILYLMSFFLRPVFSTGMTATIAFSPEMLAAAFLLAIVLSLISCILPILKISRIPVKEIVLNTMEKAVKKNHIRLAAGLAMLAGALLLPYLAPSALAMPVDSLSMLLSIAAVVMLVPYITSVFVRLFEKLYTYVFGNVGILAAKNLRENKSILNNISLLSIGISSLLLINTISSSVVIEVANVYREATFEIWMTYAWQGDKNLERLVRQVDGVTGAYGIYEAYGVELDGTGGNRISLLQGIDVTKYGDYWSTDFAGDGDALLSQLDEGRNIIISETLREKYGLKPGDTMRLMLRQTPRSYRIIGFMNTMMYNGSIALISENNLKMDTGDRFYQGMYIKTASEPDKVLDALEKQMGQRPYSMTTVKQMEYENRKANDSVFMILKGFSIMALVIGTFGVLNNLIISFIERRRSLAMLRSIGMSKSQTLKMIFIEALSGGLVGGITGVAAGYCLLWTVPFVMKAINLSVPLHFPLESIPTYVIAGMLITVAASISPAVKSSRLNIITAIKYE